jgi:hypothetical protein
MQRNKRLVKERLDRDPLCCNCGERATCAHHIVPLVLGGSDTLGNLASLCDGCHGLTHGIPLNHSEATKRGLAAAKARGVKLGGTGGSSSSLAAMNRARSKNAEEHARAVGPLIQSLRNRGNTLREIATVLNESGSRTYRGCDWKATQVQRILRRLPA